MRYDNEKNGIFKETDHIAAVPDRIAFSYGSLCVLLVSGILSVSEISWACQVLFQRTCSYRCALFCIAAFLCQYLWSIEDWLSEAHRCIHIGIFLAVVCKCDILFPDIPDGELGCKGQADRGGHADPGRFLRRVGVCLQYLLF